MIFPSFLEGRGTWVISWKYFQTILGFSSVISIVPECLLCSGTLRGTLSWTPCELRGQEGR